MENSRDKYTYLKFEDVQNYKQQKRASDLFADYFKKDFTFRSIVVANFSDKIQFMLPPGAPPFKEQQEGKDFTSLKKYFERGEVAIYLNNGKGKTALQMIKMEERFTQLLESVQYKDAKLFIAMKDKTLTDLYPKLTREFVKNSVGEKSLSEI